MASALNGTCEIPGVYTPRNSGSLESEPSPKASDLVLQLLGYLLEALRRKLMQTSGRLLCLKPFLFEATGRVASVGHERQR
jgi:hypothetical protein